MLVEFLNNCSQYVNININGKTMIVPPNTLIPMENIETPKLYFSIKCENSSRIYKGKYILNIETSYNLENLNEAITFTITREKTRVGSNVYFERLFVFANGKECIAESYNIPDETTIKKVFSKKRIVRFFLFDPLEYLTGLVVLLTFVGVLLTCILGWKCAVVYFPIAYLILLFINLCSEKFINTVFKKGFGAENVKTEFYSFFENGFVEKYYSDPNSEPFMGESETDRLF